MKRLLISIVTLCLWAFCLHAQQGEFDPANPGDPQPFYSLTVQVSPAAGGTANITRTMVAVGQEVTLRITPEKGFTFRQWVCGEEVLSTDTYLSYTMPERNVTVTAQLVYEPEAFNPESPADPQGQGENVKRHLVTVYTSPSVGGTVNVSSFRMQEGEQQQLYAYNNAGYEFIGWYVGDKLESQTNPVTLTMRESDITLTARFRFNPASPDDPGANLYDAATGTLIIDRFTPGRLSDAIYSLLGENGYGSVTSLTVVGEMAAADYGVVCSFGNLELIDFSQTTGYTAVPSWAFEDRNKLQRLLLPATVETIGANAFYGCSALKELVFYAPAPPVAEQEGDIFDGIGNELVVRVPAASAALYETSTLWNRFVILPMDVQSLNVTLPEDKVALYENMFLELLDTKSGQLRRYVITKRNRYAFTGVFDETAYQLTLRNAQNMVFGQEMVTFAGNDTTVVFSSLRTPVNVSIQVLDAKGENVNEHVAVTWYDAEDRQLQSGTEITKQAEGDILKYHLLLDATLMSEYMEPEDGVYIVSAEQTAIQCKLQNIPAVTLTGIVSDSLTSAPVQAATISVKQTVKNKYQKLFTAETDAEGRFSLSVLDIQNTTIVITADNYAKKAIAETRLQEEQKIALSPSRGTMLTLHMQYTSATTDAAQQTSQDRYADYSDLLFVIKNKTQNKWIDDYEYNFPQILIKDAANPSDEIELAVRSANGVFAPYTVLATVNEAYRANASLQLVETGGINAFCSQAPEGSVRAMLYNNAGILVNSGLYDDKGVSFHHLPAGQYTLVTMTDNNMLRSMGRLSDFEKFNLKAAEDYDRSELTVNDGLITEARISSIPEYKEFPDYLKDGATFSANKSSLVVGDYLTLRSQIDFLPQYKDKVSDVKLVVVLPQSVQLVENAVLVGSKAGSYSVSQQEVTIPLEKYNDLVRFCVIPASEGTFRTGAYIRFNSEGKTYNLPLGSAAFDVENAKIAAYIKYSNKQIIASGLTTPNSEVELYDNDELIGIVKAKPSGLWQLEAEMPYAYNLSKHKVYARITTPLGIKMMTKTKNLFYNISSNPELRTIEMKVFEQGALHAAVTWDYEKATVNPNSYQYTARDASFEFYVDFANNINVKGVNLILYMHEGQHTLPLKYDAAKDKWVGTIGTGGLGETGNGVINVGAQVYYKSDEYYLDANWLHDLLSANKEPDNAKHVEDRKTKKGKTDNEDSVMERIFAAIEQNDMNLASHLLDSLEADVIINEEEISEAEIQQILDNNDNILNQYPINVFSTDIQIIQDSLATLTNGMTIGDCKGLNQADLTGEGYTIFPKTNGDNLYIFSSEDKWEVIDFTENIHYTVDLQSNGELAKCIRRIKNADGDNGFIQFFEEANNAYQKFNDMVQAIAGVITSFQETLTKQNAALREQQGLLKKAFRNCANKPHLQKSVVQTRALNHVKIQTNHTQLTSVGRFRALQTGPGFSILAVGGTFLSGIKDGYELYNLYQSTVPCPDDEANAMSIRRDIASFGRVAGIYYVAQIGVSIAQLIIFNTSIGASFFTAGTSLITAGIAIGVVVATYVATVAYGEIFNARIKTYEARIKALECNKEPDPEPIPIPIPETYDLSPIDIEPIFPDLQAHIDPSGFVYEGVENNRVEGVKATVYYKDTHENMFGEQVEEDVMWNAWDYDQENPQYTDAEGMYQWFVPQGLWQVRFEKEGYEPTQSEWLPVPPPQLEVNIPIVQLRQPEVENAVARKDAIDITFDKYMMPGLLNTENVLVTSNGKQVAGTVTLLDEQKSYGDASVTFARKVRFVPSEEFTAKQITLTVSNRVRSYADVPMAQTFQQNFDVDGLTALEQAYAPVTSVPAGQISSGTIVELYCATPGAVIRYTLDGSTPDCMHGLVYDGTPVILGGRSTFTVKAIACADGYDPSDVAQWLYTIGTATGMPAEEQTLQQAVKVLENGHLYILMPDGSRHSVLGIRVK